LRRAFSANKKAAALPRTFADTETDSNNNNNNNNNNNMAYESTVRAPRRKKIQNT